MTRIALAALAALVTTASPAAGQMPPPCGPSRAIADMLARDHGEAVTGGGIDAAGRLLRIFANLDTGTWTAVVSTTEGLSCIVSSGKDWASERPEPAAKGQPS